MSGAEFFFARNNVTGVASVGGKFLSELPKSIVCAPCDVFFSDTKV